MVEALKTKVQVVFKFLINKLVKTLEGYQALERSGQALKKATKENALEIKREKILMTKLKSLTSIMYKIIIEQSY
jgi:hypothetical protein